MSKASEKDLQAAIWGGVVRARTEQSDAASVVTGMRVWCTSGVGLCIVGLSLWIACALFPAPATAAPTGAVGVAPTLHARSAAILDMRDGRVLWSENGHLRLPMASTTKLMTALVSLRLEHDQMNTPMIVPPQVKQAYGELLYLRPGDEYTYLQLFEGMLLPSANDAAIAIAVDSAGGLSRFVSLMNQAAVAYGLTDTHYANPDGLNAPNHYSSADDLARLGWVAMHNPVIRSVVAKTSATIAWPRHGTRLIGNINALLTQYPGADGVKTGYTSEAMNVIVGSAQRNGQSVIAVLMGEPANTFWTDEAHLLDYGIGLAAARGPVPTVAPPSAAGALVAADGSGAVTPRLTGTVAPASFSVAADRTQRPRTGGSQAVINATLIRGGTASPARIPARGGSVTGGVWAAAARLARIAGVVVGACLAVVGLLVWRRSGREHELRLVGISGAGSRNRHRRVRAF